MPRTRLFITVTLLICITAAAGNCDALEFFTPPVVTAPLIEDAPKLDGFVEPDEWAGASPLSAMIPLGGTGELASDTEVWVAYDVHQLYIGAILHHPAPDQMKAEVTEDDGPVYRDDCLEILFDPTASGEEYVHMVINPKGVRYDALGKDETVDYRWQARTAVLESGWSVELALPFAQDIPPSPGVAWGFLAGRYVPHLQQWSASSLVSNSFHETANFGKLIFGEGPVSSKLAFLGDERLGENQAAMVVQNHGSETFSGKANVRVMGPTHYGHFYSATKFSIDPGKRRVLQVPYELRQDGLNTVQFSITDAEGKTVNRTPPYPIALPGVEQAFMELEETLASAVRTWTVLEASEYRTRAEAELDRLLAQWMSLRTTYRETRRQMTTDDLEALRGEVERLSNRAEELKRELNASVQMRGSGLDARPASMMKKVSLDEPFEDFDLAFLDTRPGETAALQIVIAPFRQRTKTA
ncbi:MAG: hypothetical protein R6V19_06195 [Armatimonadota bacterium]